MSIGRGREALDRDAIVAAVDLPALADALLSTRDGKPMSPTWPCPSSDHDPTSPSPPRIAIFTTRRGDQRWSCQNCGADGSAIDLVMRAQHLGFRDALEFLARRNGHDQPHTEPRAGDDGAHPQAVVRAGVDAWIEHASQLLWEPFGQRVRDLLITERGLPEDVLRLHRIGATSITLPRHSLDTRRSVAGPRSSSPAAVLPVMSKNQAAFAQLRLVDPPAGTDRYVNPPTETSPRPHLALYRPPRRVHPEIVVTEGIIDALSANVAGYRAAAILAPGFADAETAVHLARLHGPLVIALDPDHVGNQAADRLAAHLWARGRRPALLAELRHDLNDSMVRAHDWPRKLTAHIREAIASGPPDRVPEL